MDNDGPSTECLECGLRFWVIANNDAEIMQGEPFVLYCPRCGFDDLVKEKYVGAEQ